MTAVVRKKEKERQRSHPPGRFRLQREKKKEERFLLDQLSRSNSQRRPRKEKKEGKKGRKL